MAPEALHLEIYRPALTGHCYRMLGSPFDADDAVQETMIRAWRASSRFDGRASVKSWLYKIATNVCLDELKSRGRRSRPIDEGLPASGSPPVEALTQLASAYWIEPILDAEVLDTALDPEEQMTFRQSVRLAFVAALQKLPPKQRAALLMTEVLDCSVAEVAKTLETSVASINSALQRARSSLAKRQPEVSATLTMPQQKMLDRYLTAFESYDITGLTALMHEDVTFCMPPYSLWLQSPAEVTTWMLGMGSGCRGSLLVPSSACGWPAFAQYRPAAEGGYKAWALIVLELAENEITGVTNFLDVGRLFPRFGLSLQIPQKMIGSHR